MQCPAQSETSIGHQTLTYNARMEPRVEEVLRGLEEATAFARSYRFELTADHVEVIEQVEALPQNEPGARKGSRWLGHAGRPAPIARVPTARLLHIVASKHARARRAARRSCVT